MVTIRYFAAARAARGAQQDQLSWTGSLQELLDSLAAQYPQQTAGGMTLGQIFERCTFLVNGNRSERSTALQDGDQLDILPPFAGG